MKPHCEGARSLGITGGRQRSVDGSGQDDTAGIGNNDEQESIGGVAEFLVVLLLANGLLFVTFVALPLDVAANVMAGTQDISNITNRLIDILVGVGSIAPIWLVRLVLGSLCVSLAWIDRAIAS